MMLPLTGCDCQKCLIIEPAGTDVWPTTRNDRSLAPFQGSAGFKTIRENLCQEVMAKFRSFYGLAGLFFTFTVASSSAASALIQGNASSNNPSPSVQLSVSVN